MVVLPGGGTSRKLFEMIHRPAAEMLKAGFAPLEHAEGSRPVTVDQVRELDLIEAVSLLDQEDNRRTLPKVPIDAADVMRSRHHAIARMLASGAKHSEVKAAIGVSPATINLLLRAPAFQALLLEYMNMMDKGAIDTAAKLRLLSSFGADELMNRLLTNPAAIKTPEVLEIVKISADRTGLGPTTKSVSLNGQLTPANIRALKDATLVSQDQAPLWVDASEVGEEAGLRDGEAEQAAAAGDRAGEGGVQGVVTKDDLHDIAASLDEIFRL